MDELSYKYLLELLELKLNDYKKLKITVKQDNSKRITLCTNNMRINSTMLSFIEIYWHIFGIFLYEFKY